MYKYIYICVNIYIFKNNNILYMDDSNNIDSSIVDFFEPEVITNNDYNNINKIEQNEKIVFGIDLGTTNSCISYWKNNSLIIIPDEYGNKTIPSIVAYTNKSKYVGYSAKNQKEINTENVFYEVKRLIGRKYTDKNVQNEKELLSYQIEKDNNNNILLQSTIRNNRQFVPEEISANILTKLKIMAKKYINQEVKDVIITIPANFNDGQRQATKDAAEIAGLNPLLLLNEPTAAALSYGMMCRKKNKKNEIDSDELTLLVYDFGGGTLDVSLIIVYNEVFEVKASSGNTHFGGADFDNRIIGFCLNKFKKQNNYDKLVDLSILSLQKLRTLCENAKKILSTNIKTCIGIKDFYDGKDLFISLTRKQFEILCMDLFMLCLESIEDVLDITCTNYTEIDEILLVGGMTKIPYVRTLIKKKFNKEPNCSINPNESISAGAAIQGYLITHKDDPFTNNIGLIDITSLSLGIETLGEMMDIMIPRNTMLPYEANKIYTTDTDNMKSVLIKIYEGERVMTSHNFFVGEFELTNISEAPRGVPEIKVTFKIDRNGIINVSAIDLDTNESNEIVVSGNKGRLSREEIDKLVEYSKEQEYIDEIERIKKLNYYEIKDLCMIIHENIMSKEFKLNEGNIKTIINDTNSIIEWLNKRQWDERTTEEYEEKLKQIKIKYGVLILKGNLTESEAQANCEDNDIQQTSVYGDEDDDENNKNIIFEKIEENDLGIYGMTDTKKDEIRELRKSLIELCNNIFEVVESENFVIEKNHKVELRDFIDDTLLWIYSYEKISKIEYQVKIDEIQEACNKIMDEYKTENKKVFENNIILDNNNHIDNLENLCITLKIMIDEQSLPYDFNSNKGKESLNELLETLNNNIEWVNKYKYNYDNLEKSDKIKNKELDDMANNKYIELNNLCNKIYNMNINKINLEDNVIENNKNNIDDTVYSDTEENGTSILNLVKIKQKEEIERMINE